MILNCLIVKIIRTMVDIDKVINNIINQEIVYQKM